MKISTQNILTELATKYPDQIHFRKNIIESTAKGMGYTGKDFVPLLDTRVKLGTYNLEALLVAGTFMFRIVQHVFIQLIVSCIILLHCSSKTFANGWLTGSAGHSRACCSCACLRRRSDTSKRLITCTRYSPPCVFYFGSLASGHLTYTYQRF